MADGDGGPRLTVDVVSATTVRAPRLAAWLRSVAPARARGGVTIAIVSDARVRALNKRYRKKDKATDVLSFPSEDGPPEGGPYAKHAAPSKLRRRGADVGAAFRRPSHAAHRHDVGAAFRRPSHADTYLGDIVIASAVARRQARDAGHSLQTELRILALHGLLHLLGYDHEHDDGRMARLERRLRAHGGLREGLIERTAAPARRRNLEPGTRKR